MKYYEKLLEMGCFSIENLISLVGILAAAISSIHDYQKKGYIERGYQFRNKTADTFAVSDGYKFISRFISHHSAFKA